MTDPFRFGDPRARDDMGGCCGKPVGCRIDSQGCVRKRDKADWRSAADVQVEREGSDQ